MPSIQWDIRYDGGGRDQYGVRWGVRLSGSTKEGRETTRTPRQNHSGQYFREKRGGWGYQHGVEGERADPDADADANADARNGSSGASGRLDVPREKMGPPTRQNDQNYHVSRPGETCWPNSPCRAGLGVVSILVNSKGYVPYILFFVFHVLCGLLINHTREFCYKFEIFVIQIQYILLWCTS